MKYIKELAEILVGIEDPKLMEDFLGNLLTPSELSEVSKRFQIFKLLKNGVPQRKIAEDLGVGIATISRGSRELQYGGKAVSKILAWQGKTQ